MSLSGSAGQQVCQSATVRILQSANVIHRLFDPPLERNPGNEAGIPGKSGNIGTQLHYLLIRIRYLSESKLQSGIYGITQDLDIILKRI